MHQSNFSWHLNRFDAKQNKILNIPSNQSKFIERAIEWLFLFIIQCLMPNCLSECNRRMPYSLSIRNYPVRDTFVV